LEAAPGVKYKAALSVAYGAGLRVSEVVSLKVSDIDSKRMMLRVEQGKGGARRNTTDLVALDLCLPDMDGLDVAKRRPQLVSLVFDGLRTRFRTKHGHVTRTFRAGRSSC
jgi:integrase